MFFFKKQNQIMLGLSLVLFICSDLCFSSEFCAPLVHDDFHEHHHHHDHHHHQHDSHRIKSKLQEDLADEEDMKLYGLRNYHKHHHDHDHGHLVHLTGLALWFHALGCSLLVSLASHICLIILSIMFIQGKPSKTVVDSLALFGAGAILGDAFLHQLPQAFVMQRKTTVDGKDETSKTDATDYSPNPKKSLNAKETAQASSKLVFGYLNLFSDGVLAGGLELYFCLHMSFLSRFDDFFLLLIDQYSIPTVLLLVSSLLFLLLHP